RLFRGGQKTVPFLHELPSSAAGASKQNSRIRALPPLPLGRGAGGEGPDSQTAMRPLTGLKTRALSLTLSPVGRGNWSGGGRLFRSDRRIVPSYLNRQTAQPVHQSRIAEYAHSPLSLWGEGPGVRAADSQPAM